MARTSVRFNFHKLVSCTHHSTPFTHERAAAHAIGQKKLAAAIAAEITRWENTEPIIRKPILTYRLKFAEQRSGDEFVCVTVGMQIRVWASREPSGNWYWLSSRSYWPRKHLSQRGDHWNEREEIKRKFDEIVAFAEVERFLETPVKYYSSGMYIRLAFAVAAHFEPEILILDEVLAVGDAAFREKCLAKMREVSREGRTVFYVSHDLMSVQQLCGRAFLIESGRLLDAGEPKSVTANYLRIISSPEKSTSSSE